MDGPDVPLLPIFREFAEALKAAAPTLSQQLDAIVAQWLKDLITDLDDGYLPQSPKIFNDPVWGSIILHPAEILLLDTPLLQRLRGIRQLGLAHYVFPGAVYDRLEHTRGVVEGAQRIVTALDNSIQHKDPAVPHRKHSDLEAIRLGALLHDIGHGPFSHATEHMIAARYEDEINSGTDVVLAHYPDIIKLNPAELLSILMIVSLPMLRVLMHPRFPVSEHEYLPLRVIATLVGSAQHLSAPYLAGIVSGPIDADKLDYMARDSHHAGLTIGLETERLLTQLQVATVTPQNAPNKQIRERAEKSKDGRYYDLAISRAGTNAYEQMIIGRAILFDRVYYHHKVRAAEAMVRRLITLSEGKDGEHRHDLSRLLPALTDEAFVCVLGGILRGDSYPPASEAARSLADRIRFRKLYHRAFAFATRFLAGLDALDDADAKNTRILIGRQILRIAADPALAKELEWQIAGCARKIASCLGGGYAAGTEVSSDEVIVDLPRPDRISVQGQNILVVTAEGHLESPNVYFDPMKWAQAYSANKLCGYVFCQREYVPAVSLAAKIVFAETRGVVLTEAADRLTKTSNLHSTESMKRLLDAGILSLDVWERLRRNEVRFARIEADDLRIPAKWCADGRDVGGQLAGKLQAARPKGFTHSQSERVCELIDGLCTFFDMAYEGGRLKEIKVGEEDRLQAFLRDHLRSRGYSVTEAQRISGGQQDLLFEELITIENKIHPEPTDGPLEVGEKYPWQARRYSIPTSFEVVATVVGYVPRSERGHRLGRDCIEIRQLEDGSTVEIRLAVPVGYTSPSAAKAPPHSKATRDGSDEPSLA